RRSCLPVFRKPAGRQEQSRGAIPQHVSIINFLALQLRHRNRIHLRRRWLATFQQLTGVFTLGIGATEVLAETAGLQLHFRATFVALKRWPVIPLDAERTLLDLVA